MKIGNLTQHEPTADQADVLPRSAEQAERIRKLLTFDELPSQDEIIRRAERLTDIARAGGWFYAMIGGAPYLMGTLERFLLLRGIVPVYAFSRREAVEVEREDGSVEKRTVFKHVGWVRAL